MKISLLLSILIFSLMIFVRGLYGYNLDILAILPSLFFLYSVPISILEIFTKKFLARELLEKKLDNKKIYADGLKISLLVALLPTSLIGLYFGNSWFLLLLPIFYIAFVILNFILSLIIIWSEKQKRIYSFKKALIAILAISFVLLIYSGWEFSKCEWQGCSNWIYLVERAKKEGNPSVCKLGSIGKKYNFYINIFFASQRGNSPGDDSADDLCYRDLAVETNNADLCEMVPEDYWKNACYFDLITKVKDPSLCEKAGYFKTACYRDLASKLKDPSLCEKAGEFKDRCYSDLAIELRNPSLCEKIDFNLQKDGCYRRLASELKDPSLCEKAFQKDFCLESINYEKSGN